MTAPTADIGIRPFTTHAWLRNGHAMTVYAWARRRTFPNLPAAEVRYFQVAPDTQVRADCFWQPSRVDRPLLLALHGLESSSQAHYMRGLADHAIRRGWNAVLLNQRNCGGTEHLTPGLYHSGLTVDPLAVIRELAARDGIRDIGVVGYSLGGNLTLKLAGELNGDPRLPVRAVVGVNPALDLDRCVHAIERKVNFPYQFNFVKDLRARMRRKAKAWPGAFDLRPLGNIWSIRKFDDVYTAPYHGFNGASDYYYKASAVRVIDRIGIPALILAAADDPFVPAEQFRMPLLPQNPMVTVRVETHGGHCGFISANGDGDPYWAEDAAMRFLAQYVAGGLQAAGRSAG